MHSRGARRRRGKFVRKSFDDGRGVTSLLHGAFGRAREEEGVAIIAIKIRNDTDGTGVASRAVDRPRGTAQRSGNSGDNREGEGGGLGDGRN